jgi:hypothetical protein
MRRPVFNARVDVNKLLSGRTLDILLPLAKWNIKGLRRRLLPAFRLSFRKCESILGKRRLTEDIPEITLFILKGLFNLLNLEIRESPATLAIRVALKNLLANREPAIKNAPNIMPPIIFFPEIKFPAGRFVFGRGGAGRFKFDLDAGEYALSLLYKSL